MKKEFEGLHNELSKISFPHLYLFKFIVKAEMDKIAQVESLFDSNSAKIRIRESSKGSYISITVKEIMLSPDEIIHVYDKTSKINGVIAL